MPRSLPWKVGPPDVSAPIVPPKTSRKRPFPKPEDDIPEDTSQLEGMRKEDEDYIMVEDEFLATAHLFSKAYHKAEYHKLSKEMREKYRQPIQTIQSSKRPSSSSIHSAIERMRQQEIRKKEAEENWYSKDLKAMMKPRQAGGMSLVGRVRPQSKDDTSSQFWGDSQMMPSQSGFSQMLPPELPPSRRPTNWRKKIRESQASHVLEQDDFEDELDLDDVGSSQVISSRSPPQPLRSLPFSRPPPTSPTTSSRRPHLPSTSSPTSTRTFTSTRPTPPSSSSSSSISTLPLTSSTNATSTPAALVPSPPNVFSTSPDPFDFIAAPITKSKYRGRKALERTTSTRVVKSGPGSHVKVFLGGGK